jgi:hypothetical protein
MRLTERRLQMNALQITEALPNVNCVVEEGTDTSTNQVLLLDRETNGEWMILRVVSEQDKLRVYRHEMLDNYPLFQDEAKVISTLEGLFNKPAKVMD